MLEEFGEKDSNGTACQVLTIDSGQDLLGVWGGGGVVCLSDDGAVLGALPDRVVDPEGWVLTVETN